VRVDGPVVTQRRPRESLESLTVYVDGDRLHLHRFSTEAAARDFEAFEGTWSGLPLRNRATEVRTRRIGRLVVESDPEERFVDPAQIVPIPYRSIEWAALLDSPTLDEIAGAEPEGIPAPEPGLLDVVRSLRLAGFDLIEMGLLPPGQLRPGCFNGMALTINADRFLLYRFESVGQAQRYAESEPHARAFGPLVIRSTPDTMYVHQLYEILYAGDDRVRWSPLLDDPALRRALQDVAARMPR
jgi:hypothetical protein